MRNNPASSFFSRISRDYVFILPVFLAYAVINILSLDFVYFWDNVQQISKEAHWFYENQFAYLLLPGFSEGHEIVGTGYHPPLMGMMTALLWMVFGQHLWVSHMFIAFWSVLLIYHSYKLFRYYLPDQIFGYAFVVLMLDSTLLAQIAVAAPDIILLTSFVMVMRGIIEKRPLVTAVALIFLVLINGRGMLAGVLLYLFSIIHRMSVDRHDFSFKLLFKSALPFIPAFLLFSCYLGIYLVNRGWFFSGVDSPWADGWKSPESIAGYLKNMAAFGLRLMENGRFVLWLTALFLLVNSIKNKRSITIRRELPLMALLVLMFLLFFYFAVSTQIVIGSRYYMGITLILGILVFKFLSEYQSVKRVKWYGLIVLIFFLTGNFWIYPEKTAKAWDATLAHIPYYQLRNEMFDYLETNDYDYAQIGGGFGFSSNQRYVDLKDRDLVIADSFELEYFIYSNISNLPDEHIDALNNAELWESVKSFSKGAVFVSLYQNKRSNNYE